MPRDQWKFVTTDEGLVDEEAGEELAMHVEGPDPLTPAGDVGRSDVVTAVSGPDGDGPHAVYFEDEEPEDPVAEARLEAAEERRDLEGLLEEQHYAFSGDQADDDE